MVLRKRADHGESEELRPDDIQRSSAKDDALRKQNIVRFVHGRIHRGYQQNIVAIPGNLKARRRLENKGTLATNSNVFA
jgi:hypothetical protein